MRYTLGWVAVVAIGASLCVAPHALAEEIVVRNDSLENNQEAFIVGDFGTGEQASAWLKSPCDGKIVAVQILWLAGNVGAVPTLENFIYIRAGGSSFPIPGPIIEILEGPYMQPGGINEFRYLDENETIPIDVPVTRGQTFVISFEFYNPTDILNGSASVVRDTDGCLSNVNALYGDVDPFGWGWYDMCPFYIPNPPGGDFVIRAVIDCPGVTGACCYADGGCMDEIEQADCEAEFGAVWTEGATCSEVTCTPRGACCRAGGCLTLISQADCESIGGVYAGNGTDCADNVCVAGACCFADGSCQLEFEFACGSLGGTFEGIGTACDPNPCPQPEGACCLGTFCLNAQTEAGCTGAEGVWMGAFTDCGPPNPCLATPICRGDANCDTFINFRDIDYFVAAQNDNVAAWEALFAGAPTCSFDNNDCNADGFVNFRDIDGFVALQNTTCVADD